MIAQAMIEKVTLPFHAVFARHILLPVLNRCPHPGRRWERQDRMQVVGHQQTQPAMPDEVLVIVAHGIQHGIASAGSGQLISPLRHAMDGDEEPTATRHPLRDRMREPFARRQIHVRRVRQAKTAEQDRKAEDCATNLSQAVGRVTPCAPSLVRPDLPRAEDCPPYRGRAVRRALRGVLGTPNTGCVWAASA
jgi:hypothetical protein